MEFDASRYKGSLPYPSPPKMHPVLLKHGSKLTMDEASQVPALVSAREQAMTDYAQAKVAYGAEQTAIRERFVNDIAVAFGVSDNPKKEKLFEVAWSLGHSSGYGEVWNYYAELVELIK